MIIGIYTSVINDKTLLCSNLMENKETSEAEYHAMAHATSEILWPRNLLASLQVPCT